MFWWKLLSDFLLLHQTLPLLVFSSCALPLPLCAPPLYRDSWAYYIYFSEVLEPALPLQTHTRLSEFEWDAIFMVSVVVSDGKGVILVRAWPAWAWCTFAFTFGSKIINREREQKKVFELALVASRIRRICDKCCIEFFFAYRSLTFKKAPATSISEDERWILTVHAVFDGALQKYSQKPNTAVVERVWAGEIRWYFELLRVENVHIHFHWSTQQQRLDQLLNSILAAS